TINPTNGTPTIAVQRPTSAMESFSKNRRRLISSGVSLSRGDEDSVGLVFMANFRDPAGKRCDEEGNTDEPNDPGGDQPPKEKGRAHRLPGWKVSGARQWCIG